MKDKSKLDEIKEWFVDGDTKHSKRRAGMKLVGGLSLVPVYPAIATAIATVAVPVAVYGIVAGAVSWGIGAVTGVKKWEEFGEKTMKASAFTLALPVFPLVVAAEGAYTFLKGGENPTWGITPTLVNLYNGRAFKSKDELEEEKRRSNQPIQQSQEFQRQVNQQPIQNIDVSQVSRCQSFVQAQATYVESLKSVPEDKKFTINNEIMNDDGSKTIIYDSPGKHNDKDYQVMYKVSASGKIESITGGSKATCILPPIEKEDGKFELNRLENGQKSPVVKQGRVISISPPNSAQHIPSINTRRIKSNSGRGGR